MGSLQRILSPELTSTASCRTPVSLEPVTAWHLQLRALEGIAPTREMRHPHLVLRAILIPPGPVPFKGHGKVLQPSPLSQKRERYIWSLSRTSVVHLVLNSKAGANRTSIQLALRAQIVYCWALVIGCTFLSTAKETGKSLSRLDSCLGPLEQSWK